MFPQHSHSRGGGLRDDPIVLFGYHTPGTATRLTPDGTVVQANLTSPADVDYYVFSAQTGAQYVIETFDLAEANDTHLEVYGGDGAELLARNDDGDQETGASLLAFIPLVSGDYLVCVRAYCQESGAYSLRVTGSPATTGPWSHTPPLIVDGPVVRRTLTYPLVEDWFSFETSPGIRYFLETSDLVEGCDTTLTLYSAGLAALAYDDDGGGELCSLLAWMPDTAGQYYVKVAAYNKMSVGTFSIRLTTAPPMNAQIMVVNGPEVYGVLSEADEQDYYWFEAEAGKTYRVYTLGLSSGCDTILRVADPDLLEIDINDDYGAGGNASAVTFTAVQSGPHIATVASYQERIGTYGVRVVPGAATGFDLLDTSGMATAVMVAVGDDPTPGVLSPAAESNWFRFRVSPGTLQRRPSLAPAGHRLSAARPLFLRLRLSDGLGRVLAAHGHGQESGHVLVHGTEVGQHDRLDEVARQHALLPDADGCLIPHLAVGHVELEVAQDEVIVGPGQVLGGRYAGRFRDLDRSDGVEDKNAPVFFDVGHGRPAP